jgi:prephenate dehydrogenase
MNIGLIGFGRLGQLISKYLVKDFSLFIFDQKKDYEKDIHLLGAQAASFIDVSKCDIIILCVPISNFEHCVRDLSKSIKKESIVIDVCSVKETPIQIMKEFLPKDVQILGTHPMFGPDSVGESLSGAKIALCQVGVEEKMYKKIKDYLKSRGLRVLETTAKDHDEQISRSLLLTQLIGRTLMAFGAEEVEIDTKGYQRLLTILEHVGNDSLQLFKDMNNHNKYAKKMISEFSKALQQTIHGLS